MSRKQYDVFLSYSRNDTDFARNLAELLRSKGVKPWIDQWELKTGDSWREQIEEGIQSSKAALILLSPSAKSSEWVSKEWSALLERSWENPEVRLIPVLIDDAELPPFVRDRKYIRASGDPAKLDETIKSILESLNDSNEHSVQTLISKIIDPKEREKRFAAVREAIQVALPDDETE